MATMIRVKITKNLHKRGISLSNNICKLFVNIMKGTLQFTEVQAEARQEKTELQLTKYFKREHQMVNQHIYIAFIDLEKTFDTTWVQGVFFNLWNRGIKDKIWRIM